MYGDVRVGHSTYVRAEAKRPPVSDSHISYEIDHGAEYLELKNTLFIDMPYV